MLTKEELDIYNSIVIRSNNDPNNPEFPFSDPKFPATETRKIYIEDWGNIFIKDESTNLTGTHKDRMAWEIVTFYKQFLDAKKSGIEIDDLPQMSIISSGSAALAIQTALKIFNLPDLKVLVDFRISSKIRNKLEVIGCEIFETDLSRKLLSGEDILSITNNLNGFDITSSQTFKPGEIFYDWLSYEILNENPTMCFVPFGTGHLYENILNTSRREILHPAKDPRFFGDKNMGLDKFRGVIF